MKRTWPIMRAMVKVGVRSFQKEYATAARVGMESTGIRLFWPPRTSRVAATRPNAATYQLRWTERDGR